MVVGAVALATMVFTGTKVSAQCSEIDASSFTFELVESTTTNTQISWTFEDFNGSFDNRIALEFGELNSGARYRFESTGTDGAGEFSTSTLPAGSYTLNIRAYCTEGDSSEMFDAGIGTITVEENCQHYDTWMQFQFQNATDTYILYCDQSSSSGIYSISGRNSFMNTTGATVTYSIDNEDIATCNNAGQLTFTGEPGTVVVTATGSMTGYCDTTASFTLTVVKPELSFNTITITPVCYVIEDENYGMDGNVDISFNCQCTNNNLYRYTISPAPNTQIATSGQAGGSSNGGSLSFYGVHPDTYTITIYIENTDISIDTTIVVPTKLSVSVQGDSSTVCSANPNLTLIANATAVQGYSIGTLSYSWEDGNSNVLSTNQSCAITTGNINPVLTVTESANNCQVSYAPTINWIDGYGAIIIDSVTTTPTCGNSGTITVYASAECGDPGFVYSLSNGESNSDGVFVSLIHGDYAVTVSEPTYGSDTTFTVTVEEEVRTVCDIPSDGSTRLDIYDYDYHDQENGHNGPSDWQFYYVAKVPYPDSVLNGGVLSSVEFQYSNLEDGFTDYIYLDPTTGRDYVKIPIPYKGNWEVKVRARCCGAFPGEILSDWVLTDTIHHYVGSNLDFWNVNDVCRYNDGYAEIYILKPHDYNIEPRGTYSDVKLRIRLTNETTLEEIADNEYEAGSGVNILAIDEEYNLPVGEYLVHPYISNDEGEELCSLNLDTTFTIEYKVKVTIENDSSVFCSNDSVLYRAIVTGGTAPYSYVWAEQEHAYGYDDTLWVTGEMINPNNPSVEVTDASNCINDKSFYFTINPAYTEATEESINGYPFYDNTYSYESGTRYVTYNQCPFTWGDISYECSMGEDSVVVHMHTAEGCDSTRHVHLETLAEEFIAMPGNGTLDTTLGENAITVVDDGGGSGGFYTLNGDGTIILRAPEGKTLTLAMNNGANIGDDDVIYIYDYAGVNSNMLIGEYRNGYNPIPETDMRSGAVTLRFVSGSKHLNSSGASSGFSFTVTPKTADCLPVYNVTYRSRVSAPSTQYTIANTTWEHSGDVIGYATRQIALKWNDATGTMDTVEKPNWSVTTEAFKQFGHYGIYNGRNYLDSNWTYVGQIRAICSEGDTSEAVEFSYQLISDYRIPASGDTIIYLDSTVSSIYVYDDGGYDGNYSDNSNGSLIVKPAEGYKLIISQSSSYDLESSWDYLYITDDYDGSAINAYNLDTLTGNGTLGTNLESRSGGFKITLTSDGSNTDTGVVLYITQNKLDECLPSYNPKAEHRLMDITTYYVITDAGIYGATAGDQVVVKKTNVETSAIEYDTMTLEMWDNSIALRIEPQYTMDVQLAPLCGYSTTPTWSDALRLSACQMPYDLFTNVIGTETSVQISWTGDASSYVVGYRMAYTDEWNYVSTPDATTEITLTGLFPSTTYEAKVASVCGDGDTSVFSDELFNITFSTGCGYTPGLPDGNALTSIPDVLNFDLAESSLTYHYEMPDCWSRIETVVTDPTDGTQKPYPHVTYTYIGQDQNQNRLEFYSNASDDQYAIMPTVILQDQASNWNIAFNASIEDTNCVYDGLYFLEFGVMTDPSDPTTFTTRKTVDLSTLSDDNVLYNFTESDVVDGNKIYPAFKVAKRIGWNFHHAHILLNSVKFVPNYGLTTPTNVKVTPHPTQDNRVVITWDADELQTGDDQTSIRYEVAVSRNSNLDYMDDTVITTSYNTVTVPVLPGVMVGVKVSTMVLSSDYAAFSPWYSNPSETVQYLVSPYDRMAADTIGDITVVPTPEWASSSYPIQYGEQASSVMLLLSSELQNVRNISAIAFRQAPDCGTSGFQNVEVYMKDVDITEFSTTGSGSYTIDNAADFTFTIDDRKWETMVAPDGDGWMIIEPRDGDSTIVHDPSKNLMIGIASWGGDYPDGSVRFVMDEDGYGKGLTMVGVDQVIGLDSRTFSSDPLAYRPQMMVFENKNCVGDTLTVDTNLCENATLEWRGQTIDLNASDAGLHFNSDLYRFIYYDTVPNAVNGGTCDSIYMLRVARKYNKEPDEADRVNNCGPYTWHGTTYYHSNGEMVEVEITPGCSEMQWQGTDPITDTVRGVTSDGCDSIYTLHLTVNPYHTIIFDSTYADAGTGMSDWYVCNTSSTVPNCTMTRRYYDFGAWLYDGDTVWANETLQLTEDTIILQPLWEPACYNYTDSLMVVTDYEDFCMTNSSYTWHGHTVDFAYLRAHGYVLPTVWGDSYDTIYVDDTIVNAAGGVCDSIYRLRLTVGDRLMVTDYFSEIADAVVCGAGYTWSDGRHYTADTGYFWWSDPDDSDHYSYANLNFNAAPYYIDSTTNAGCGTLHMLGIAVDDTVPGITVTFIKYYQEYATSLDTLYAMTASVCEDVPYIVPDMPDSVTREGYRFVHWTDNPACGWTVDPGEEKELNSDYLIFYGVWESTCSDVEVGDTMTLCSNDTVDWHGTTWIGQQYTPGEEYYEPIQRYDVIPGECDSIFNLLIIVPNELSVSTMPSGSSTYCLNQQASQIELPISGGGSYTCEWYKDGEAVTDHNPGDASNKYTPSTATAGSYTLSAKVVAECGSDSVEVQIVTVYDIPAVTSVSSDTAYCGGSYPEELRVEADGGSGALTYQWYMNGEPLTNSNNFAYSPRTDTVGTFVYSVKVTDAMCGGSDSIAVATITVQEDIQLTTFVDTTYCYGATAEAITLNTSGGTGDFSYTWIVANHDDMMPAETLSSTTNVCVPITDSAAEYYYRVFITSGICYTERDVARIYVLEPVKIQVTVDSSTICFGTEGTTYDLTDYTSGGNYSDFTYQWYENGGELFDETSSSYMPVGSTAGTFVISAIAKDDIGCSSDTTIVGVLTVYDELAVTAADQDIGYCVNGDADTLRVNVRGSGNYSYRWFVHDFYETVLATTESYKPATDEAGTTIYDVEVTDNECGYDTTVTVATVTVYENFSATVNVPFIDVCINSQPGAFSADVYGSGDYSFQWYRGNGDEITGAIDGETNSSFVPTTDSAYGMTVFLSVTDNHGCGDTTIYASAFFVNDTLRYTGFDYNSTFDSLHCFGVEDSLWVYNTGGVGSPTYTWYIDGGQVNPNHENNVFTLPASTAGTYDLSVKLTSQSGCGVDSVHVVTFTVYDQFEVNVEEQTNIYCHNDTPDTLTLAGQISGSGEYEYQWYAVTGETTEIIDTLTGATNSWYVPATSTVGEVEYRVKVTDLGCGGDTIVSMGYIEVADSLRVTSGVSRQEGCLANGFGNFSVTYEGGAGEVDYVWYHNGEQVYRDMVNEFAPTVDSAGEFEYYLILRSSMGCSSDSVLAGIVTVYDTLHIPEPGSDTLYYCANSNDSIRITATGGSGRFFYYWYRNGEWIAENWAGGPAIPVDTLPGEYNYYVQIGDSIGCGEGYQYFAPVRVRANSSGIDTRVVCDSMQWIDGNTYTVNTNTLTTLPTFTLAGADMNGCDSTVTLDLTVNQSVRLYGGSDNPYIDTMMYCYNSQIIVYSEYQDPQNYTYQWYKDGVAVDGMTAWEDSIAATESGEHLFSLKVTPLNGCASDSALIKYAIVYEPLVINTVELDTAGCMDGSFIFLYQDVYSLVTGGSGAYGHIWYEIVGNDTIESDALYDDRVYPDSVGPGEYNYVMRVYDGNACGEGIGVNATVTVAENYTASFVSNEDDSTTMSDISVCAIKGLVLPDNEFTYPNYNFVGWGTATTADTLQPGDTVYITGNTTYYTLWEFVCQNIDTTEIARICEGSSTTWHGYTVDGTVEAYVDTVTGVVNELCDSIYHLLVEVGTPNEHDTTLTVCDSITWNGTLYTETPDTTLVYVLANGNMYGCDSTDKLTLTVIYSGHEYEVVTACDSYTMNDTIYTESADLPTITGEMPNGCPFYTHMSLTVHHSYYGDTSVTACVEYTWNDMTMRESGEQEFRGQTIEGCDSVVMLNLTINPATYGVDEQVVCDSLTWLDGNTYYDGFEADFNFITYTFEGANQYGCDSIVALGITMMEHIDVAFQSDYGEGWMDPTQTCENTPMVVPDCDYENPGYRFGGWLDVETGDTIQPGDTVTMENGRSYIAIWIPICNDAYVVTDTVMCTGDSLLWCGQLMAGDDLVSGSYEHVAYDVIENACDSIYMLRLTVYPTGHAEYYDTVHGEYMWNGEIYSTTGDYTVWVGRNRWGCDSLETLHLVVNLGIDDSDLDNMKLYPNPTRGDVNIEGVEVKKVEVLDMVGRTVATFEGSNHIDITDLPSGTYTLAITTMDDRLVTRRVAKR